MSSRENHQMVKLKLRVKERESKRKRKRKKREDPSSVANQKKRITSGNRS
jgi:hypothetical protein